MLTITLREGTSDAMCNRHLNEFLKRLNQRIYSRRYLNKGLHLQGFAVRERTKRGTLHFHILIFFDANECSLTKLKDAINEVVNSYLRIHTSTGSKPIFEHTGVHLAAYNNEGNNRLEAYLTKTISNPHSYNEDTTSPIGLLGVNNVEFGSDVGRARY
jgi:hypothetical protein